jgi:hypothetical protein
MTKELDLKPMVPQIGNFLFDVVQKCFELIKQNKKVTFTALDQMIKSFDQESLDIIKESFRY